MRAPKPDLTYAELFLPRCTAILEAADLKSSRYYWPIRALRFIARFPHQFDTWLWHSHTVPNGNPPEPFDATRRLSSFILLRPTLMPPEFQKLKISAEKTVHFFAVVPLYADELAVKLQKGTEAIETAFASSGFSERSTSTAKAPSRPKGFFQNCLANKIGTQGQLRHFDRTLNSGSSAAEILLLISVPSCSKFVSPIPSLFLRFFVVNFLL